MATVKKLINQKGHFEDATKFDWQPMESSEKRRSLYVPIVCDNPSKCIVDTLTGYTTTFNTNGGNGK